MEIICRTYLEENYNRNFGDIFIQQNKNPKVILKADTTTSVWGKTFTTNSNNGRISSGRNSKRKKTKLHLGDSVSMGCGVSDSSTFTFWISEKDTSFSYLNPSVAGWSVTDYLEYLKDYLQTKQQRDSLEEVSVFYCLNDIYGKSKTSDLPEIGNKGFISTFSKVVSEYSSVYKLMKLFVNQNSNHYFTYDLQFYKPENSNLTSCMATLDSINQLMKYNNIKWNLYILPYRSCIGNEQTELRQFVYQLKKMNCPVTFLNSIFVKQEADSYYLWSDEIHFNEKGHKTIANFFIPN